MRKKGLFFIPAGLLLLLFLAGYVYGGRLTPPTDNPDSNATGNVMHSLYDIYKLVKTRIETPLRGPGFKNPDADDFSNGMPGVAQDTNCTLDKLYNAVRYTATVGKPTGDTTYYLYNKFGGIPYPVPRFTIKPYGNCTDSENPALCTESDDTVIDHLTGLEWTRSGRWGENNGYVKFDEAQYTATQCRAGGYSDWRLPSAPELQTLIDYAYYGTALPNTQGIGQSTPEEPFIHIQTDKPHQTPGSGWAKYWTTTQYNMDVRKVIGIRLSDGAMESCRVFTEQGPSLFVRGNAEQP